MMWSIHSSLTWVYICVIWLNTHLNFYSCLPLETVYVILELDQGDFELPSLPVSASRVSALIKGVHYHAQLLLPPFKINLCCVCGTCESACMLRSERGAKSVFIDYCLVLKRCHRALFWQGQWAPMIHSTSVLQCWCYSTHSHTQLLHVFWYSNSCPHLCRTNTLTHEDISPFTLLGPFFWRFYTLLWGILTLSFFLGYACIHSYYIYSPSYSLTPNPSASWMPDAIMHHQVSWRWIW